MLAASFEFQFFICMISGAVLFSNFGDLVMAPVLVPPGQSKVQGVRPFWSPYSV